MADKPVTGLTVWASSTTGTTTQLDANFAALQGAINDFNTYDNYIADTGGANAYAVTLPANTTGALTVGLLIQFKASAVNTGASTFNYNATGALNIKRIDGTTLAAGDIPANGIVQVQYDGTQWLLQTPYSTSSSQAVPIRQTVLTGPASTGGFPTLLPTSCTSLTFTTSNITATAPLVVAAANGFGSTGGSDRVGYTTGNLTWTGLTANSVNYLAVTVAANGNMTTAFTAVAPVYAFGNASTTGNGNYSFSVQGMQMQVGNGTATAQTYSVFVGEANCNSNAVVSAIAYAYQGQYISANTALPATGANTTFPANLGYPPQFTQAVAIGVNQGAEYGYTTGQTAKLMARETGTSIPLDPFQFANTANIVLQAGSAAAPFCLINRLNGSLAGVTNANWNVSVYASRLFV
jgi:hypothetical protein